MINRLRVIFSSAAILVVSAGTLHGQVPVVQPDGATPRIANQGEIPIVSTPMAAREKAGSQGNKAVIHSEIPIVSPAPSGLQPLSPVATSPASPPIVKPSGDAAKRSSGFAPQVKAAHPDVSLPTEVPIVKQAMSGKASQPESKVATVAASENPPPTTAVIAHPRELVPVVRVGTNLVPVIKSPEMPNGLNSPQQIEVGNGSRPQVPQTRGTDLPEMALPPIKPGEEFPRTPRQLSEGKATGAQAIVEKERKWSFESIPVGSGAAKGQDGITRPNSPQAISVPAAAPILAQDFSETPLVQSAQPSPHSHEHLPGVPEIEESYSEQNSVSSELGNNYLHGGDNGCEHCSGAGCSHCGLGGWNSLGNRAMVNLGGGCDNGCFGLLPCTQNYFIGDVLYWTRNGGNVVGTDFGGVYDYNWNFGTQITMGTRVDPLYGHELSYFGLFDLDAGHTDVSSAGEIDARFTPGGGLTFADTSAFFDAVETTQTANSSLHSFQVNRVRLGWDVVQSHLGLRYIRFDEDYRLQSKNLSGDTGLLSLDARNNLIGPEVGIKLFYDVGRRISFSTHWKLGGYLNAYRTSTFLQNKGITRVNNSDSGTGFAATFDLGANAHIHLTQRLRLRGGYGVLWLWDVASVTGNYPSFLTPASGTSTNDSENAIFHGTNVGFEYYW